MWVLPVCQKSSTTSRKKFEWPELKKCWQDTTQIHIFWRIWSLWMRHGSPCSIRKKRHSIQWKHSESPPTKKFRVDASAEKIHYSNFLDQNGVNLSYPLSKGMTITGECYRDVLKIQLLRTVAEMRPELVGNFILHQDNAPPHKARIVTEFLVEQGIETLRHPPYSPDLAPSDFLFSDTLKLSLHGREFPSRWSPGSAVYRSLNTYLKTLVKMLWKVSWAWQWCLDKEGHYVENYLLCYRWFYAIKYIWEYLCVNFGLHIVCGSER